MLTASHTTRSVLKRALRLIQRRGNEQGEDTVAAKDVRGLLGKENKPTQVLHLIVDLKDGERLHPVKGSSERLQTCFQLCWKRTVGHWKKIGLRLGNSSSKGRRKAVVEELARFEGAGGGAVCARASVATMNAHPVGKLIETLSVTELIAASPLEAICTEVSISTPGALLSELTLSPTDTRIPRRLRIVHVQRAASLFMRPEKCAPTKLPECFCTLRLPLPPLP
eukprot:6213258-Pleurochrysis_carterae.AAC.1